MSAIPTAERAERFRNVTLMSAPALWPAWPMLPVVRRTKGVEECGLMYDCRGAPRLAGLAATVVIANLFLLPATLDEFLTLPRETFDTFEEVFEAGWRVD